MKRAMAALLPLFLLGCDFGDSSSVAGITPITGLKLPAEEVVGTKGCGTADTQVFKYVVYVSNQQGFRVAALYDCFADAYFVDLPTEGGEATAYTVQVLAFNRTAFESQSAAINASVTSADPGTLVPSQRFTCSATEQPEAQVVVRCRAAA